MIQGLLSALLLLALTQSTAVFSGTLLDPTGRPLTGVAISLIDSASHKAFDTRTDDGGRFSFEGLPAGDYSVKVSKPGFTDDAARIIIASGQHVQRQVVPQIVSLMQSYRVLPPTGSAPSAGAPQRTIVLTTAPEDPCARSTSGGCLTPPTRMVEAWPVYPRSRLEKGISGTVTISARLGTDGFLKEFQPTDGTDPEFAAAAIEALRVWEYSPLRLNGIPQEGRFTISFQFIAGTD